jgi:hypothetical protein
MTRLRRTPARRGRVRRVAIVLLAAGVLVLVLAASAGAVSRATTPPPDPNPSSASVQAHAREILNEHRFSTKPEPPGPLDRAGAWVSKQFERFLPHSSPSFSTSSGASGLLQGLIWLVLGGILVLVIFVVVRQIVLARRDPRPKKKAKKTTAEAPADEGLGEYADERDADVLERAATAAEARGDYAFAIRLLFRVGLLRLQDRGALVFSPSLTTGQVVRSVPAVALIPVAREFDAVAYGDRPAGAPDTASARAGWREVLDEVAP